MPQIEINLTQEGILQGTERKILYSKSSILSIMEQKYLSVAIEQRTTGEAQQKSAFNYYNNSQ